MLPHEGFEAFEGFSDFFVFRSHLRMQTPLRSTCKVSFVLCPPCLVLNLITFAIEAARAEDVLQILEPDGQFNGRFLNMVGIRTIAIGA